MKLTNTIITTIATLAIIGISNAKDIVIQEKPQPIVEVAFVLDTTGSMSGLIAGAKKKIWDIANQIVTGKPTPKVRMAIIGYRDKGDKYITKVFGLSDNIDKVYEDLQTFAAQGGGDGPEHVNKGLHDAIYNLKWTDTKQNPNVVKLIYLVGDCPAHNDYKDTPTSDKLAKAAIEKGICINTVLCGGNSQAKSQWQQIASIADGTFVAISQDGGMQQIATPYDKKLAEKNSELMKTVIVYGSADKQSKARVQNMKASEIAPTAAPGRASYMAKQKSVGTADLVGAVEEGKVKLEKLDKDELPAELKGKTTEEQKAYIQQQNQKRKAIQAEISELNKKRNAYILDEKKKKNIKSEFDENVLKGLKKQASKAGIKY